MSALPEKMIHILRVGHKGDGETAEGVFVPFTLAGEDVAISQDDRGNYAVEVISPSPDRVKPVCRHFGTCGACQLQHMAPKAYLDWKREQVIIALAQRGLEGIEVEPTIAIAPGTRRRATFSARRIPDRVVIGFQERGGHFINDMQECPVLHPQLLALVPKLQLALEPELPERGQAELALTLTDTGIDAAFGIPGAKLDREQRARLAILADRLRFARLTVNEDLVHQSSPPLMKWGRGQVALPPASFLQATREAEAVMQGHVSADVGKARKVADLFSGCGAFTLPLAESHAVYAYDSEEGAIAALTQALRGLQGIKPATAERRDLFRRPLLKHELDAFDAVVIDPPRAGARAQVEQLARSKVARIAAVSCNPATFARDARILVDGGYRLRVVRPIDQFLWSAHIELTALFERD
jgi:23S rRNA (uracil1939-C5)-methyltransferase